MQRIFLFVLLGLLPLNAVADGKVFSHRTAIAETVIPDQRALICWSNGVERLVIETRFVGEGTNFAWVVPLPGVPEIEAATSGVFATLAYQLRPDLIHSPPPWGSLFLSVIGVGWLVASSLRSRRFGLQTFLACLLVGVGLIPVIPIGWMFVTLFLIWASERVLRGRDSVVELLVVLLLLLLFASMLLPSLGTAGMKATSSSELTELASARVGAFETKTISAKTTSALLDWLRENEFKISTNAEPVIADYIKRGWVFVASKLAREGAAAATNSIHPLSFTFRTEQPVYPMRLTGVEAVPLSVELYVFGAERAEAKHFSVATCVGATYPVEPYFRTKPENPVPIMHPLLRTWAQGTPVATKLTAKLSPTQMQEDVMLNWVKFAPVRQSVYSQSAAFIIAANWATGLMCGCFLLALLVRRLWLDPKRSPRQIAFGVVGAGLMLGITIYASLPTVSVRTGRFHPAFMRSNLEHLAHNTVMEWQDSPPKTLEEARKAVVFDEPIKTNNFLLGGSLREEDSPGNYSIRQTTNGFEFLWYDGNGAEQRVRLPR